MYFKYIRLVIKSRMQYRLSTWMTLTGRLLECIFSFVGIYFLFDRFGAVDGWTFAEVAVCYGVVQTAFAITECFARGFDTFSSAVTKGDFDRVMLRPRGTVLQVFGSAFEISCLGKLAQSITVLCLALSWLGTTFTPVKLFTLILMVLSGVSIFTGILIVGAGICFFTVQGLEVLNIFTYGGKEITQYPLAIYNKWIVRFFTFIIPFGSFNYLPLMFITGRTDGSGWLYMLSPLYGFLFLVPCLLFWRHGVKHYLSTGS